MKNSSYFMPTNKKNCLIYFSKGLIMPVIYDSEEGQKNRASDIQGKFPDSIVLIAKEHIYSLRDTDRLDYRDNIFLEIFIFPNESDYLKVSEKGVYLYEKPIPVSRILKIHTLFDDGIAKQNLETLVRTYDDSFIPESLLNFDALYPAKKGTEKKESGEESDLFSYGTETEEKIDEDTKNISPEQKNEFKNIEKAKTSPISAEPEFQKAIKRYDRVLGMFAFMRNTFKYYPIQFDANLFQYKKNDLDHIDLILINMINMSIGFDDEILQNKEKFEKIFLFIVNEKNSSTAKKESEKLLFNIINTIDQDIGFTEDVIKNILNKSLSPSTKKEVEKYFKAVFERDFIGTTEKIYQIHIKEKSTIWCYILLIKLYQFNYKGISDIKASKENFTKIINEHNFLPYVLFAVLGYYYGYSRLPVFESINNHPDVKGGLRGGNYHATKYTTLNVYERLLIESVYQHIFNKKESQQCDYNSFFSLFPTEKLSVPKRIKFKGQDYVSVEQSILLNLDGKKYEIRKHKYYHYDLFFMSCIFNENSNIVDIEEIKKYISDRIDNEYKEDNMAPSKYLTHFFIGKGYYRINVKNNKAEFCLEKKDICSYIKRQKKMKCLTDILECIELDALSDNKKRQLLMTNYLDNFSLNHLDMKIIS